jgi:hypothetical protein
MKRVILAIALAGLLGCVSAPVASEAWTPGPYVVYHMGDENGRLEFLASPCRRVEVLVNIQEKYHSFFHQLKATAMSPGAKSFETCWALMPDGSGVMVMTESGRALRPISLDSFQKGPADVKPLPGLGQEV